ncbi:electron transfer flavoprotein beta subunit lysine methyltransferase-like [Anopheles bellator]|uniref:electron transfer flavoprotein beta subunit lysine methyltransferase-like n=1 Tax=Anopheles bellator TaxID=139047 RepID=UPI002647FD53|nr:electron transfer flavoprotein beta subunit lysine methyltransferase-like [Anopheles bellator]
MTSIAYHATRNQTRGGSGLVVVAIRTFGVRTFPPVTRAATKGLWTAARLTTTPTKVHSLRHKAADNHAAHVPDKVRVTTTTTVADPQRVFLSTDKESDLVTIRAKILSNTVLSRRHLTPEIALHLITTDCTIYHRPVDAAFPFKRDPFWGFYWPGGQALTRFILDAAQRFRGKSVLDIGCGCGASAIAAIKVGARHVTANDIDPVALEATMLNAEANGIEPLGTLSISDGNLIDGSAAADDSHFDSVLIGDLFYDTEIAADLRPWLQRLAQAGKEIFIGDPGRHGITETGVLRHMELLARYELPVNVCLENNGFSHANVWQFRSQLDR